MNGGRDDVDHGVGRNSDKEVRTQWADMIFVKMFTPADFRRQVYIIKEVKCKNECTGHPGSFFGEPMNKCDLQ